MSNHDEPLYRFWQPRYWPIWVGVALLRLVVLLPRRAQVWVANGLGRLLFLVLGDRRRIAAANLRICFPELSDDERRTLLIRNFESLGHFAVELALTWWASDEQLDEWTQINGVEHVEAALAKGRGVLLLSGHFTANEISGRALRPLIPPMAALYRPSKNPLIDEIMRRCRGRSVAELIAKDSIRSLVRALKKNVVVWYAPDQAYTGKNSVLAPFFGEPAMTNPATSQLARISGAAVIPYFPRRLPDGRYVVDILPPLEAFPSDDLAEDARRINQLLEELIRKAPDEYYWVHRRFKSRPEGFVDPYD